MLKNLAATFCLMLLSVSLVSASGFQLKFIGGLDVTGAVSKEWWYTTANPKLSGISSAGSAVTIKIDEVDYPASVDAAGNWNYQPTVLNDGDHTVSLTSSAGSQSFTLHIGQNIPADVTAPAPKDMPVAGSSEQTMWLFLGAGFILAAGVATLPVKK